MEKFYDLIVIGGGPGGYVCAIKAAQLGMNVACVEGRGALGGTCLNVGCIPSKALLHASEQFHQAESIFPKMGLETDSVKVNLQKMMEYKQGIIDSNTKGIDFLFKKNKIDYIQGWAKILDPEHVQVMFGSDKKSFRARYIVIATGSVPASLLGVEIDEKKVVTSTGALSLGFIPETMTVIGAGVIGLELGSVWNRLGTKVTVIEYADHIVSGVDLELSKHFQRSLKKQGIKFLVGTAVQKVSCENDKPSVEYIRGKDKTLVSKIDSDVVLLATGRIPYTKDLGLENIGIVPDKRGAIDVNSSWQTSVENIYAIGDVIKGPMLAHKAEEEGVAVAEILSGQKGHVEYNLIPSVIYTHPEVATVGLNEEQLKEQGRSYKGGKFSFIGNGRAKALFSTDGFVKILADSRTDQILGVHIIGPQAGEMIHECAVALEFGASSEDLARTCHAHPTLSEAVKEAAMASFSSAIHA